MQALAWWFVIWAALVSIPPGHTEQKNVIRMNMVGGNERFVDTICIFVSTDCERRNVGAHLPGTL